MHCLHVLRRSTFGRDETHRRSARGLADRLRIARIVLICFDGRPYELGTDEPQPVTKLLNLARPVVRACTPPSLPGNGADWLRNLTTAAARVAFATRAFPSHGSREA